MSDQAEKLRQLVGATAARAGEIAPPDGHEDRAAPGAGRNRARARFVLFTSGKGSAGLGTSNLVLNLAIAAGRWSSECWLWTVTSGWRISTCWAGSTAPHDLGDVLQGRCELLDAVMTGRRHRRRAERAAPHEHERSRGMLRSGWPREVKAGVRV